MVQDARRDIVRIGEIGVYHCWSRCVQRAFLCGYDKYTDTDFSYRRTWMEKLLEYQAGVFAIDVGSYNILSNHCHAVLRTRPDLVEAWSDEEVARRWKKAWPNFDGTHWSREPTEKQILELLVDPKKIAKIREGLSSLSYFMARWKEPIARICNSEMGTTGHFWEARFGSRELLDEAAVITCSMYVDLNQVKAGLASSLVDSEHSSIRTRILAAQQKEAEESHAEFHRQERSGDFEFSIPTAEGLFEDCWLSPINRDGPLMTGEAVRLYGRTIAVPDNDDGYGESDVVKESDGISNTEASPATDTADPDATEPTVSISVEMGEAEKRYELQNTPREPNTNRPAAKMPRRHRASDSPYIGIPWSEYLRVLEGLVAMMAVGGVKPEETDVGGGILEELAGSLLSWGMNPKAWVASLNGLNRQCHHILGAPEAVESRASEKGKRCYFGINFCRSIFETETMTGNATGSSTSNEAEFT
jgi:hypothetical protein